MIANALRLVALPLVLVSTVAAAEPIHLKLAYFSSDRSQLYLTGVKNFVDAVNSDGNGRVKIDVYFSGTLGNEIARQSQLLRDGAADIAYIVAPSERALFPDAAVIELPGLYKNATEATLVFSKLVEANVIRGFGDYFVIGAFTSEPESVHTRAPVASLADLSGKRIRVNNETEMEILKKLNITPSVIPLNQTTRAISSGAIDGALVPPVPLVDFGIGRVAPNHYFLRTSCIPLALLMTRKKFDSLPGEVQAIIRKYSGAWFRDEYIQTYGAATAQIMRQLEADPKTQVKYPSPADMQTADGVFKSVIGDYVAASPHNAELVGAARAAVANLRSAGQDGRGIK
jgi:TRAP-type C4-dicarboxylate transport system substrate-binding protein